MSCEVDCVRRVNEFFFLMNSYSFSIHVPSHLMMMKIFFIEPMTTWINPSSHKFIFDYSMLSSMNSVIREWEWECVCVCLSSNWWQSVSANNLDVCTQSSIYHSLTLMCTRVHKWFFFSWNVCYIDDRQAYRNSC